ncbi:GNAT family N-acetyltransferase, cg3035/Rv0428c family [Corynebacterium tapiri]|uniref:Histone acetyltransferase Rv0428c-like C-terminal domain-containing protein n=1 Tax=Corynebacterium tapiri TaxID=1448266 RepID=A0A5C4U3W1_9CORY|nr:hypothetical protein FHE74_09190 [Corynebacterium tapiri]
MSRIFRSDDVSIGERVVVRRVFGDVHSDVIGHVTSLEPLRLRPQEVGGYPSSLPEVEVPAEQIGIIKRLSPRRVRNSDIRRGEQAWAQEHPASEEQWTSDGQWLMRIGADNAALPLGRSAGVTPAPLAEIVEFYRARNLPPRVCLVERLGATAEPHVADWELGEETLVMLDESGAQFHVSASDTEELERLREQGFVEHHRRRYATSV